MKFLIPLLIPGFLAGAVQAAEKSCAVDPGDFSQASNFGSLTCALDCEGYYHENPDSRPAPGEKAVCARSWQDQSLKALSPEACASGAWKGILSLPETWRAYGMMVENVAARLVRTGEENRAFIRRCDKDPACRREIARSFLQYNAKNEKGDYVVPDKVVDEEAQKSDIVSLLSKAEHQASAVQRSCETILSQITQDLRAKGLEPFDFATARYETLARREPSCVGSLKMKAPLPQDFEVKEHPSWLAGLGIKLPCYPMEKAAELACLEIASLVVDPLVLTGGAYTAAVLAKAGIKKMMAREGAKQAVRAEAPTLGASAAEAGPLQAAEELSSIPFTERKDLLSRNLRASAAERRLQGDGEAATRRYGANLEDVTNPKQPLKSEDIPFAPNQNVFVVEKKNELTFKQLREIKLTARPGRIAAASKEKVDEIFSSLEKNPVSGSCQISKYDPSGEKGLCYGRAVAGQIEALRGGMSKDSIKRIWAFGNPEGPDAEVWSYHVATMIRGEDGNWYVLDNLYPKPLTAEEWAKGLTKNTGAGRTRFYFTEGDRFSQYGINEDNPANLRRWMRASDRNLAAPFHEDLMRSYREQAREVLRQRRLERQSP